MSAARKEKFVAVEDYLAGELHSPIKHEYVAGAVYAMAGSRNVHNRISGNLFGVLFGRLRGKRCQPYNSDTKIRIRMATHIRFYYPDLSIVCRPNPPADSFQDEPVGICEVLSPSTRRIDEGEKKEAYLSIPTLHLYALVDSSRPEVVLYRRKEQGFECEVYDRMEAVIPLPELGTELPLAEIYEGVVFVAEESESAPGFAG